MELKIEYSNISLTNKKLEAMVVFVAEDSDLLGSGLRALPGSLKKNLSTSLKLRVFTGKNGKSQHLFSGYAKIPQILAVGLGKKDKLDAETLRRAAGIAGKMLITLKANTVGFVITSLLQDSFETDAGQVLVEGLTLGAYEFNAYKKTDDELSKPKSVIIQCCDPDNLTSLKALKAGKIRADATNMARNLGNTPANDLKPKDIAAEATKIARQHKIECTVLEEKDMKKLGIRRLPRNLLQATEALQKNKLAEKVMGKVMLNSYVQYKNDEWERYHQAVTDWEVKEYLRLY